MWASTRNASQPSNKKLQKQKRELLGVSFKPQNFIPGLVIGFIFGLFLDWSKPTKTLSKKKNFLPGKLQEQDFVSSNADQELKIVLVVRQDLKMKSGKIASQCAHAATGIYAELMRSDRSLLRQWEDCGQPKIVVTCRNQQEMNKLREAAESISLPTFVVADAGRTQVLSDRARILSTLSVSLQHDGVSAGSKTVLAIGPGPKAAVDSVTGKLNLL